MADETPATGPTGSNEVGKADVVLGSVGRGTTSINDYVTWVDEAGAAMFGTVNGIVPGDGMVSLSVRPDGGGDSVLVDATLVSKAKRPKPAAAPSNPEPQVEGETPAPAGPNSEAVAALLNRMAEELGFLQGPDGKFIGSEPDSDSEKDTESDAGSGGTTESGSGELAPVDAAVAFADTDMASGLDPAGDNLYSTPEIDLFLTEGGVDITDNAWAEDDQTGYNPAEELVTQIAEQTQPSPVEFTATMENISSPAFEPSDTLADAEKMLGAMPGESPFIAQGNPLAVAEEAGNSHMMVQATFPEGHPIINLGVGNVPQVSPGSTAVIPHPDTIYTPTGISSDEQGNTIVTATASMPDWYQPSGSASVEGAATFERGEVIRGERGLLAGSEPGPLSGQDRAEYISMIGGALLDEDSKDALNTVIGGDAVFATAEQVATLANLMETGDEGNPISAVTGSSPITVTMPAFYPSDTLMNTPESVEGMPRGADTFQMGDVFGGSTFPVYGIGSGQEAAELTTTIPNAPAAVLQIEVPPGHPSIGIEGNDMKAEGGVPQPLDSPNNSNGIVLHPDTVFTTTSASVDAKTGTAVVSVTASMPPGFGQNNEEG